MLLDKGFIRPSASSWGVYVLFVKKKEGSMRTDDFILSHKRVNEYKNDKLIDKESSIEYTWRKKLKILVRKCV